MKKIKKIYAILIALLIVLTAAMPAFADEPETAKGSITVTNAVNGQVYTAYKIFDLSYNAGLQSYRYTLLPAWEGFFTGAAEGETDEDGYDYSEYFTFITGGLVTGTEMEEDSSELAQMAKDAVAYAKATGIAGTPATASGGRAVISDLTLGYYAVDSAIGTICMLDTAEEDVDIIDKNSTPSVDKKIVKGALSLTENTVSVGDTVDYKVTVSAKKGALNYVLHDTMDEGLTLDETTITVAGLTETTDYTVELPGTACAEDCSFEISFTETYLNSIAADTNIVITYTATLNENAVTGTSGNKNSATLTYGNGIKSNTAEVTTYTYEFDIVKTDADNILLEGAEFEIRTSEDDEDTVLYFVPVYEMALNEETGVKEPTTNIIGYMVSDETTVGASTVIPGGKVTVMGLEGNKTYYVFETEAPEYYNRVYDAYPVTLTNANNNAVMTIDGGNQVYASGGVQVINQKGVELPSTGGIGTVIFYVLGAVLVIGAVIFLVTKKKASMEEA